jgi:hypothetical protein
VRRCQSSPLFHFFCASILLAFVIGASAADDSIFGEALFGEGKERRDPKKTKEPKKTYRRLIPARRQKTGPTRFLLARSAEPADLALFSVF